MWAGGIASQIKTVRFYFLASGSSGVGFFKICTLTPIALPVKSALTESVTLNAHGAQIWALDKKSRALDDAYLIDSFRTGIGVEVVF